MFNNSGRTGVIYSALLGSLLLMPTQALTQGDMVIEEIMVTATKREERLQDVPMAVSVLTEDEIQSRGIENPYDIARRTAGLDFQSASGLNSQYIIRGVSMSSSQGTKVDKTVMVYLDDMPITSSLNDVQAHLNLYDIGRIEVLKGPQGTLFGSGTLAGVVRMISNQPDPTSLDYSVKLEVGSTKGQMRQRVGGMVNIPLSDTMALRVVGYNNSEDGYNTNTYFGDSPTDNYEDYGLRANLSWEINDQFKAKLGYVYHDQQMDDMSLHDPELGQFKRDSWLMETYPADVEYYNLTLEYDLGFATLMSSSNYLDSFSMQNNNLANIGLPMVDIGIAFGNAEIAKVQEIRLTSSGDSRLQWVAGYFRADRENDYKQVLHTSDAWVESRGGTIAGLFDEPGYADNAFIYGSYRTNNTIESALFAEVSYDITDSLKGTIGIRRGTFEQDDERFAGGNCCWTSPGNFLFGVVFGQNAPLVGWTPTPYDNVLFGTGKVDADTSKLALAWQATDDTNFYATVSEGWRAPKYNGEAVEGAVSPVDPTDIVINLLSEPDSLWNYEVGVKSTWLDGSLTTNVALYQIDWEQIQRQATRRSDSAGFVANGGDADIKGLEFELFGAVNDGLNIGFNATFQDAEIANATADQQAATGSSIGARLVSPKFKAALFVEKYVNMAGKELILRGDVQHIGSAPNGMPNTVGQVGVPSSAFEMIDSYQNMNASVAWKMGDWDVQLYGENIIDNDDYTFILPEFSIPGRHGTLRPRTFGIRVSTSRQ